MFYSTHMSFSRVSLFKLRTLVRNGVRRINWSEPNALPFLTCEVDRASKEDHVIELNLSFPTGCPLGTTSIVVFCKAFPFLHHLRSVLFASRSLDVTFDAAGHAELEALASLIVTRAGPSSALWPPVRMKTRRCCRPSFPRPSPLSRYSPMASAHAYHEHRRRPLPRCRLRRRPRHCPIS